MVALFFMATGSACAADPELGPPGPDGIPRAAAGHPWKIYYGARFVDSLDYPQMAVVRAGAWLLVSWPILVSGRSIFPTRQPFRNGDICGASQP